MLNKCQGCEFAKQIQTSASWAYNFTTQVVDIDHVDEVIVFPEYIKWSSNFGLFLTLFRGVIHQKTLPILFLSQCNSWVKHNKRARDIKYCLQDRNHLNFSNKTLYFFGSKAAELFNIPKPLRFYKKYFIEECFLGNNIKVYVFPSYYKFVNDLNTNMDFVKNALILSSNDNVQFKDCTQTDMDFLNKENKLIIDIESNNMLNQFDSKFIITHLGIGTFKNDLIYLVKDPNLIKQLNISNKTIVGFNTAWDIIAFLCFIKKEYLIDFIQMEDVMLLSYLINENRSLSTGNNLKGLSLAEFGLAEYYEPLHDIERLQSEMTKLEKKLQQVKTAVAKEKYTQKLKTCSQEYMTKIGLMDEYNAKDVYYTKKLYEKYNFQIVELYSSNFIKYMNKALGFLTRLRIKGLGIDYNKTKTMFEEQTKELELIKNNILQIASIDPMSNLSVSNYFLSKYGKYGLPFIKTISGQVSCSSENLITYSQRKPFQKYKELLNLFELIDTYRSIQKNRSFLKIILDKAIDGTIHGEYSLVRTVTGRVASSQPNMQQFPKEVLNKVIKSQFKEKGIIIEFDYRQAEFRIFAMLANEQKVKDILNIGKNVDMYKAIASQSLNIPESDVTPIQRDQYKIVSLATIYGITPYGLAKQLDIDREEAESIQESFFNNFPAFHDYIEAVAENVLTNKFVLGANGRYRRFPELFNDNYKLTNNIKARIIREAVNFNAQSTSSDVTLYNAIYVQHKLLEANLKSNVINLIHDSIVIDVLLSEKEKVLQIFKETALEIPPFIKKNLPLILPLEYEIKEINYE